MTYEELLAAITGGTRAEMRPANPTIKDTLHARYVIERYGKGETVPWYKDAPLEEVAFHLWNAAYSLRTK